MLGVDALVASAHSVGRGALQGLLKLDGHAIHVHR